MLPDPASLREGDTVTITYQYPAWPQAHTCTGVLRHRHGPPFSRALWLHGSIPGKTTGRLLVVYTTGGFSETIKSVEVHHADDSAFFEEI